MITDMLKRRRLACAVGTDESNAAVEVETEVDLLKKCRLAGVAERDILDLANRTCV